MLLTLVAVVAAVLIVLALFVAGVIPGLNAGSNGSASHSVTFSQTGLPAGTSWSVTLGGATQSSTGTILFSEKNGNYSFSVPAVTGYTQSPASGYVVVSGTPLSEAITFSGSTPLGTEFAWGSPVNATGSTPPGCTSAVDHYCYTIEIAAAGSGLSTSDFELALLNSVGGKSAWPSGGVTVSLINPVGNDVASTYAPGTASWSPAAVAVAAGYTIVIYTNSLGAGNGLLGDELVALGANGYSGTVPSNAFT